MRPTFRLGGKLNPPRTLTMGRLLRSTAQTSGLQCGSAFTNYGHAREAPISLGVRSTIRDLRDFWGPQRWSGEIAPKAPCR